MSFRPLPATHDRALLREVGPQMYIKFFNLQNISVFTSRHPDCST